ncbi:hypothetical protein [Sphingobacterium corticis]|uniref:hypothetical protein n=1 Tax=Sphingobacterium corticis TaxID=1812823 RepID=UPI0036D396D3
MFNKLMRFSAYILLGLLIFMIVFIWHLEDPRFTSWERPIQTMISLFMVLSVVNKSVNRKGSKSDT